MADKKEPTIQEIAEGALLRATMTGGKHVIVMVGTDEGLLHTAWTGSPLVLRGLGEIGIDSVRDAFKLHRPEAPKAE